MLKRLVALSASLLALIVVSLVVACATSAIAPDYRFPEGADAIDIPFTEMGGHMRVAVTVDGHGPLVFVLDSAGRNLVTKAAAQRLGLREEGEVHGMGVGNEPVRIGLTQVRTLEVGKVSLHDQRFLIVDLPMEGVDGLIGYEVLKRFPTRIDYMQDRITLFNPKTFRYAGSAAALPLQINHGHPSVEGRVDGIAGLFTLDTGSSGPLTLHSPFVTRHALVEKYGAKTRIASGAGVGGIAFAMGARPRELKLGNVTVDSPVAYLSQQTGGAFANEQIAGNVGYGVLRRFTVTLDYPGERLYLEPNANFNAPYAVDRSGLWCFPAGNRCAVKFVADESPAARAGIRVDDRIASVDGIDVANLSLNALRDRFRAPAGTRVVVGLESQSAARTIELRDLF